MKLDMSRDADNFLDALDAKVYRQIARKIFALLNEPRTADSETLKGYAYRRVDSGEYRIVYEIDADSDTVSIVLIGKRNGDEVYDRLKRL